MNQRYKALLHIGNDSEGVPLLIQSIILAMADVCVDHDYVVLSESIVKQVESSIGNFSIGVVPYSAKFLLGEKFINFTCGENFSAKNSISPLNKAEKSLKGKKFILLNMYE